MVSWLLLVCEWIYCGAVTKSGFATQNTLSVSMVHDRNQNLRVMATPTWPVPYYQRAFRHPASVSKRNGDLSYFNVPLSDCHVVMAKELLKLEGHGYVVEAIEQHYDIPNYKTSFKDSSEFSRAYVDDLLDCLGVANEQNVRLLKDHDLSDVFN